MSTWTNKAKPHVHLYLIIHIYPPRHDTHQCKQAASPCCSLDQPLCTRTFHLGFVGNCESWDVLFYHRHYQQFDSPHPRCPSTPVRLVGCTTLLKWALVQWPWVEDRTLFLLPRRSVSRSMESQTGECCHTAGKLLTLQCKRRRQNEQVRHMAELYLISTYCGPRACARLSEPVDNEFVSVKSPTDLSNYSKAFGLTIYQTSKDTYHNRRKEKWTVGRQHSLPFWINVSVHVHHWKRHFRTFGPRCYYYFIMPHALRH